MRRPVALAALTACLVGGALAATLDPELAEQGFEHLTFDDKASNRFSVAPDGTIRVESTASVSLIERPVDVDVQVTPVLAWRWRVEEGVPPTDLTEKGGDDRSLAIYVTFPYRPEDASLFERMKREVVEAVAGEAAPGRVIGYVFGGRGTRGEIQENPWFGDAGATVILRPATAPTGAWLDERVDLAADYERIFGSAADDPTHFAISADSDDTRSRIRAAVVGLRFEAP